MRHFLRSWFHTAAKFEIWEEGDEAEVLQQIPTDTPPLCFTVGQKFIVQEVVPQPQHGVFMLVGGRFDAGILSYRCKKVSK